MPLKNENSDNIQNDAGELLAAGQNRSVLLVSSVFCVPLFLRERLEGGQSVWVILGCRFPLRRLLSVVSMSRPLWTQEGSTHSLMWGWSRMTPNQTMSGPISNCKRRRGWSSWGACERLLSSSRIIEPDSW